MAIGKNPYYTVYIHRCPNNKIYVGCTSQTLEDRWRSTGIGYKTQAFWDAICEFGWRNISHEIVAENLDRESAEKLEAELILKYKSNDPEYGYNVRYGGSKSKWREDSVEKLRQANIGKHPSDETKKKLHDFNIGKKLSQETKDKISATMKKRGIPEEQLKRMHEARKGIPNKKAWRPIRRIEDDVVFPNAIEAAHSVGLTSRGGIRNACEGRNKTAGGYHWEFADDCKD